LIDQLRAAGKLNSGLANSLQVKLDAAAAQMAAGNAATAVNQLQALLNELDALVQAGRLTEAHAAPLRAEVARVIESIN
jgi:hypothetical protein